MSYSLDNNNSKATWYPCLISYQSILHQVNSCIICVCLPITPVYSLIIVTPVYPSARISPLDTVNIGVYICFITPVYLLRSNGKIASNSLIETAQWIFLKHVCWTKNILVYSFLIQGRERSLRTNVRETQKAQTFDPKLKLTAAKDVTITTWAMNSSLQLHWANYSRGRMTWIKKYCYPERTHFSIIQLSYNRGFSLKTAWLNLMWRKNCFTLPLLSILSCLQTKSYPSNCILESLYTKLS